MNKMWKVLAFGKRFHFLCVGFLGGRGVERRAVFSLERHAVSPGSLRRRHFDQGPDGGTSWGRGDGAVLDLGA